jgi:hypothetical protein
MHSLFDISIYPYFFDIKENQHLKDEINRLKGEKGKPSFKPNASSHDDVPPRFNIGTKKGFGIWKKDLINYFQ